MTDHHGAVGAPVPAVPVTETDMVLGRRGLTEFKPVAQEVGGTGEARTAIWMAALTPAHMAHVLSMRV